MAAFESYDHLDKQQINVSNILHWHYKRIIESINRRLSFHQKYKNPWTIEVTEAINREVFIKSFQAIRDYKIEHGRTYSVKRDRRGNGTHYTLRFTNLGALRFHLHKLSGLEKEEIDRLFSKHSSTKGKACVQLSEEQPCLMEYNSLKCTLKLNLYYHVENIYGNVISI